MKKAVALILTIVLLTSMLAGNFTVQAETISKSPFYFLNFDRSFDASRYQYVNWMPYTWINTEKFNADSTQINIGLYFDDYSTSNLEDAAVALHDEFKNRPAGT